MSNITLNKEDVADAMASKLLNQTDLCVRAQITVNTFKRLMDGRGSTPRTVKKVLRVLRLSRSSVIRVVAN